MSIEIDEEEIDDEQAVEALGETAKELEDDELRLNKLLRNKTLHDGVALANEVVQTIFPSLKDVALQAHQVATLHQEGILELQDALYNQTPKAIGALLTVLCENNVIASADQVRIMELLVTEESESFLSPTDSALILEQLQNYEKLLGADANGQLSPLQNVIARVKDITLKDEEDDEDEEDDGTIESSGTQVEEAEA